MCTGWGIGFYWWVEAFAQNIFSYWYLHFLKIYFDFTSCLDLTDNIDIVCVFLLAFIFKTLKMGQKNSTKILCPTVWSENTRRTVWRCDHQYNCLRMPIKNLYNLLTRTIIYQSTNSSQPAVAGYNGCLSRKRKYGTNLEWLSSTIPLSCLPQVMISPTLTLQKIVLGLSALIAELSGFNSLKRDYLNTTKYGRIHR